MRKASETVDGFQFRVTSETYNTEDGFQIVWAEELVDYIRNEGGDLQVYWDDFELWKGDARTGIYQEVFDSISLTEAESSYTKAADVVADNIYVYTNYTQTGNNSAISIIDSGDAINIPLTVTQSGWYKLNLRVRSGTSTNDIYYFDDGHNIWGYAKGVLK